MPALASHRTNLNPTAGVAVKLTLVPPAAGVGLAVAVPHAGVLTGVLVLAVTVVPKTALTDTLLSGIGNVVVRELAFAKLTLVLPGTISHRMKLKPEPGFAVKLTVVFFATLLKSALAVPPAVVVTLILYVAADAKTGAIVTLPEGIINVASACNPPSDIIASPVTTFQPSNTYPVAGTADIEIDVPGGIAEYCAVLVPPDTDCMVTVYAVAVAG